MKLYIAAQQRLEIEAARHRMFYNYGCAFNMARTVSIVPTLTSTDLISYELYKNNRCVNSSTDLEYIFSFAEKEMKGEPTAINLVEDLSNYRFFIVLDSHTGQLKLLPIFFSKKDADGTFKIISDFTYDFDSDGYAKRSGVQIRSVFVDLPSALDFILLTYARAQFIFKGEIHPLEVYLDECSIKDRHVVFKDAKTKDYVAMSRVGNNLCYLGRELSKVILDP